MVQEMLREAHGRYLFGIASVYLFCHFLIL
jgi:hypothetical protein